MRIRAQFIVIVISLILLPGIGCDREGFPAGRFNPDTVNFGRSMKGWELYNWKSGTDWKHSILVGTNRIKTLEEVMQNPLAVTGTDSLKRLINRIPEEEWLFWIGKAWLGSCWPYDSGELCLPDTLVINQIRALCKERNIQLMVDGGLE